MRRWWQLAIDRISLTTRATHQAAVAVGEALVAGEITSHPVLVRFGRRIVQEGGAHVPPDWANGCYQEALRVQ